MGTWERLKKYFYLSVLFTHLTFIILLTAILLMPNFNARRPNVHSSESEYRCRKCSISCLVSLFLGLHNSLPHRLRSLLSFHVILCSSDSLTNCNSQHSQYVLRSRTISSKFSTFGVACAYL